MCLAIPSKVVALDGLIATVEAFGDRRHVNLLLLGEEAAQVALGDYLLVQSGTFAFRRVAPEAAIESLQLFAQILDRKS